MIRENVLSSQIKSIGFDEDNNQMDIEFWPGSVYRYDNITKELFEEFKFSDSLGRFFGKRIKDFPEKYPFKKIRPSDREIDRKRKDGYVWNEALCVYETGEEVLL